MADRNSLEPGMIGWVDLTVPDAEATRDFYEHVVGWTSSEVAMGGYHDYSMNANGRMVAGICHARGENAGLPPVWLVYFTVRDLDESLRRCVERGGKVRVPPKAFGQGRYTVIEDPVGAVVALFQPAQ